MLRLSETLQDIYLTTVVSEHKWWLENGRREPSDINYCIITF